jgi:hypothetical protein
MVLVESVGPFCSTRVSLPRLRRLADGSFIFLPLSISSYYPQLHGVRIFPVVAVLQHFPSFSPPLEIYSIFKYTSWLIPCLEDLSGSVVIKVINIQ